ncbi:MAG TPA: tetratricopeptide repeat protein, partial [Thermoplasmata archaeon]|nr:tetratricopeptide repeat protein [Thermoplasmata archaeon]
MVDPPPVGAAAGPSAGPGPVEESRRLWRSAGELEARGDPSGYADALRGYVAFVEGHRRALEPAASEAAGNLDEAGMAFYRLAKADLALQSVEAGLVLAPGNASLQHHKALILLALNRNLDEVLPLLDNALTANPHDKAIWATRGDALRLVDRNADAAESYLQAQRLDATSSQYVDRALKLVPNHPEALRLKVELARAHGGDKSAVAAIDALLKEVPDDLALHCTKAEILAGLGETEAALAELHPLTSQAPAPRGPQLLQARILLKAGRTEAGLAAVRALTKAPEGEALEPAVLEVADLVEASGQDAGLALELRQAVATGDPRNLANLRALKELALRTQRLEAAAAACRAMLAVAPDHIEALRGIAEISLLEGKNDAAFAAFRDLLKAHPGAVPEARHAMEAAVGAGRSQDVLDFSQAVLAADPSDTAARRIRAEALTRSGDVAGALAEYDQWIATAPADIEP